MGKKLESKFIEVDSGLNIHVEIAGSGEPLLCLSGFANSNMNFHSLIDDLSENYQLIMVDNRGMGKSDKANGPYSFSAIAQDAITVMDKLGFNRFSVLGISMGGFIAQEIALTAPERVKVLGLLATKGPGPAYPITFRVTKEGFTGFMQLDADLQHQIAIEKYVHPDFLAANPERVKELIELRKVYEGGLVLDQALYQLEACDNWLDQEKDLTAINCPTIIITARDDNFIVVENAEVLHKQIKNSEMHVIENASHLFFFEKPKEVASLIGPFLEKHLCETTSES